MAKAPKTERSHRAASKSMNGIVGTGKIKGKRNDSTTSPTKKEKENGIVLYQSVYNGTKSARRKSSVREKSEPKRSAEIN